MTRSAYVSLSRRIVFFWSPKAGNSSLAGWFVRAATPVSRWDRFENRAEWFVRAASIARHPLARDLVEKLDFDQYTLCRNPYTRALSAYWDKFVVMGRERGPDRLEVFAQRLCMDVAGGDWARRGLSFREYLQYTGEKIASRGQQEPDLDNHFSTQVPFSFENFRYQNILYLEKPEEVARTLNKRLRVDLDFPTKRQRAMAPDDPALEDLSEVSSVDLIALGVTPARSQFLNPETREAIRQAYDLDFRKLGYPF